MSKKKKNKKSFNPKDSVLKNGIYAVGSAKNKKGTRKGAIKYN